MAETITNHGESLIAQKIGNKETLTVDTIVLSLIPNLDPEEPIDRDSQLPPSEHIVYQEEVTQSGYVNPNQVVYSLFMDNTVGPFEFNRMDLVASEDNNTNIAIATFPTQNKIAEDPENGIRGQSMTRNFMTVYDGAQAVTGITVEAAVWQIDFMARLKDSDELKRESNRDTYGRACFCQNALKVVNSDGEFQLLPGTAYVEGIRIFYKNEQAIEPGTLPKDVWLDVSLQGNLNGVSAIVETKYSTEPKSDYTDANGVHHYLEKVAEISSAGVVTDTRRHVEITDHLLEYLESPLWENVREKPSTYPPSSHTHTWSQISDKPAYATRWPTYDEVTGKPSTYPPSSHSHTWNEINDKPAYATRWPTHDEVTGKPSTYPPSSHTHPWSEVTSKPSSYPPSSHTHSWDEITDPPDTPDSFRPGMILMWAGTESQIPAGWQLCNGSGSTTNGIKVPDLRNRFILGSGSSYDTGDTGGSTSASTSNTGSHSHSVTVNSGGSHSHTISVNSGGSHDHDFDTDSAGNHSHSVTVNSGGSHDHSFSTSSAGSHSHTVSVSSGGTHSHTVTVNGTTLSIGQLASHKHLSPGMWADTSDQGNSWTGEYGYEARSSEYCTPQTGGKYNRAQPYTQPLGSSQSHTHSASTASNTGSHSHSATTGSTGNHAHSGTTNTDGSHNHSASSGSTGNHNHSGTTDSNGSHSHSASSNSTGSHTHNASSGSTGSHAHTVSTMSPYYALAYIIKL